MATNPQYRRNPFVRRCGGVGALLLFGCTRVAGLADDYRLGAMSGGVGGGQVEAASASAAGSTPASSGAGGAKPCTFGAPEGCAADEKCGIADAATNTVACIAAGTKQAWQTCSVDEDCTAGTVCDFFRSVCKPLCTSAATCTFVGKKGVVSFTTQGDCVPLRRSNGTEFEPANVKHCTAQCEPSKGSPCDASGPTTCIETSIGGASFDCVKSGGKPYGSSCKEDSDCSAGMLCISPSGVEGECTPWCAEPAKAPSSACPVDRPICYPLVPKVSYTLDGKVVEYGACGT